MKNGCNLVNFFFNQVTSVFHLRGGEIKKSFLGLPIVDFCSKVFTRSLVTCFEFFLKFAKFPMKSDSRLKKLEWMGIYLNSNESRQLEIYCKQLNQTKIEIGAGFYFL